MFDLSVPTTHAERRAVRQAWAAYPWSLRRAVVRAAERGVRHPHQAAAWAAVVFAAAVLRPRGPHWWQDTRGSRYALPYLLATAVVLGGTAGWLIASSGPSSAAGWALLVLALLLGGYVGFLITLYRQCGRLLAPWTAPQPR